MSRVLSSAIMIPVPQPLSEHLPPPPPPPPLLLLLVVVVVLVLPLLPPPPAIMMPPGPCCPSVFMGVALVDYGSLPFFAGTFMNFLDHTNLTDGEVPLPAGLPRPDCKALPFSCAPTVFICCSSTIDISKAEPPLLSVCLSSGAGLPRPERCHRRDLPRQAGRRPGALPGTQAVFLLCFHWDFAA
eukprot:SAG22_NODE_1810_length_3525_cov_13.151781_4_plen_185_part_00